jgi:hypothetical protein
MTRRPVRVHIDRLVLDGVSPGDRAAFTRAFERELARRLTQVEVDPARTGDAKLATAPQGDPSSAARAAAAALATRLGGGRS